jgi:hypothetical protein
MLALSELRETDRFRQPVVDRRIRQRFPVRLEARYKMVDAAGAHTGLAKTIDISRSGVLIEAEIAAAAGRRVELSIYWPVQLDGKCGLQLVASGRVIWCNGTRIGIQTEKNHDFRTTGIKRLAVLAHHEPDSTGRPELVHPRSLPTSRRPVTSGNAPDAPLSVLRRVER